MSAVFIMRRPGIIVVSGVVKEIRNDQIAIENEWYMPVSRKTVAITCRLDTEPGVAARMKLQPGAMVIASCMDSFPVQMLLEGAEVSEREFTFKAYNIRYNGSFDFEQHGTEKEQHVFSGCVLDARAGQSRSGKTWTRMVIVWKKNGKEEKRNVVYWSDIGEDLTDMRGKKAIFVTGPRSVSQGSVYYVANAYHEV